MNNLKISDELICPVCGETAQVHIKRIQLLLDDVRYDVCYCDKCKSEWKFYYKVVECNYEVTNVTHSVNSDTDETTTEQQV